MCVCECYVCVGVCVQCYPIVYSHVSADDARSSQADLMGHKYTHDELLDKECLWVGRDNQAHSCRGAAILQ